MTYPSKESSGVRTATFLHHCRISACIPNGEQEHCDINTTTAAAATTTTTTPTKQQQHQLNNNNTNDDDDDDDHSKE
jgi:hypothetical protein